jgi:hypothetical protein
MQSACNQSAFDSMQSVESNRQDFAAHHAAMNDARLRGDQMEDRARAEHHMQRRITTREYAEKE